MLDRFVPALLLGIRVIRARVVVSSASGLVFGVDRAGYLHKGVAPKGAEGQTEGHRRCGGSTSVCDTNVHRSLVKS